MNTGVEHWDYMGVPEPFFSQFFFLSGHKEDEMWKQPLKNKLLNWDMHSQNIIISKLSSANQILLL